MVTKCVHYLDLRPARTSVKGEISCKLVEIFFRLWEEKSLAVVASPKLICEHFLWPTFKRIITALELQDIQLDNLPQGLHPLIYVNDYAENKIDEMFLWNGLLKCCEKFFNYPVPIRCQYWMNRATIKTELSSQWNYPLKYQYYNKSLTAESARNTSAIEYAYSLKNAFMYEAPRTHPLVVIFAKSLN